MHEINIYGEIGADFNLVKLERALQDFRGKDLRVNIHSDGGDIEEAISIFNRLRRFAKEKKVKITTNVEGKCKSSGVTIFLAGDERVINKNTTLFIHQVGSMMMGVANPVELDKLKKETEKIQSLMIEIYSRRTGMNKMQLLKMLQEDTTINAAEAINLKFATKTNFYNMTPFKKLFAANKKSAFLNLILQSGDGEPYDLPDLRAGEIPKNGDTIKKDGRNFTGEVIFPLMGEAIKIIAEDGKIISIEEASYEVNAHEAVVEDGGNEDGENEKVDIAELQNKIKSLEEKMAKFDVVEKELANIKKLSFGNAMTQGKKIPVETKQQRVIEFKVKDKI